MDIKRARSGWRPVRGPSIIIKEKNKAKNCSRPPEIIITTGNRFFIKSEKTGIRSFLGIM
jgi:hypothetical protein